VSGWFRRGVTFVTLTDDPAGRPYLGRPVWAEPKAGDVVGLGEWTARLEIRGEVCRVFAVVLIMNDRSLTPRVRAALRRLAAGPQDMRDEALLQEINDEMKKLPVEEVAYVRDRVRYSCPPCPMVESVVLMLNGLIEVKNLGL